MLPRYDTLLQSPCQLGTPCFRLQLTPYDLRLLHQLGLSLGFLAAYQVMLDAVAVSVYCFLGALIFWRRSADWMALFCAFMLVLFGGVGLTNILQDTLAAFNATLRSEVDLNELRHHLLAVVQETVQPTHVSLWLRKNNQESKTNSLTTTTFTSSSTQQE